MKLKKIIAAILCITMIAAIAVVMPISSFATDFPMVTGATSLEKREITIEGYSTGVTLTQMQLAKGTKYSRYSAGVLNIVEVPTGNNGVTVKVNSHGSYNYSHSTVGNAVLAYNSANSDGTVIAAVNGGPWMMPNYFCDYDGDGNTATGSGLKYASIPGGFIMVDGEIYQSAQLADEAYLAKSGSEFRNPDLAQGQNVFVAYSDGTYDVTSAPGCVYTVKNLTQNYTLKSSSSVSMGINRLPAPDSIILYNHRGGTASMAYSDAYEIYLTA